MRLLDVGLTRESSKRAVIILYSTYAKDELDEVDAHSVHLDVNQH